MHALVTGGAGFIGSHLVDHLLKDGWRVTVVDNFDPFYDRSIKEDYFSGHRKNEGYRLVEADIKDENLGDSLPADIGVIVHLAARAGVRPSILDPIGYQQTNVGGTQNLLEFARERSVKQFIFASSSSVYGVNPNVPWSEEDHVLRPISPYASTKVSGELLGHVYSRVYGMRFIALRFFTVYGPRQRPDLAIHKFSRMMHRGESLPIFGDGTTRRDYTYIDDIIAGIRAAMDYTETNYEVINLGNNQTVSLMELIKALEEAFGLQANLSFLPEQPGDVPQTWADISKAKKLLGYNPSTSLKQGLASFADWLIFS